MSVCQRRAARRRMINRYRKGRKLGVSVAESIRRERIKAERMLKSGNMR